MQRSWVPRTYGQELCVDLVDDLQMSRQQPLHQVDRPALQRFRQYRVVSVRTRGRHDLPRLHTHQTNKHRVNLEQIFA